MTETLIKDNIFPSLNSKDLENYVDCIRRKLTKTEKNGVTYSSDLLEVIYTYKWALFYYNSWLAIFY